MLTEEQFLLDTIEYYSADPANRRCSDPITGMCQYSPELARRLHSEGCAIGRYMTKEEMALNGNFQGDVLNLSEEGKIPKKLFHFDIDFLEDVQVLHDRRVNWSDAGLTDSGRACVKQIVRNFSLNEAMFAKYVTNDELISP
jgi:hypothetical protein